MAAIKNPKCPHCGDYLQYKMACYYAMHTFDPASGEYELGQVEEAEDDPGPWCPSCSLEITEKDFEQTELAPNDHGE
jgi:hypothetical protein